jgi:glycosyltransferase involved in cell wall biosynthesis
MRVTCLIDHLISGGAQRQLCTLAAFLQRRGHEVTVLTYHSNEFFLPLLREAGVGYRCVSARTKAGRVWALRRALRAGNQDVVLAYLEGPCLYAELAGLPWRRWGLVVSERNAIPASHRARFPWRRWLHRTANYVVTNSHTNRLMLEHAVPSLRGRVVTIYNALDLQKFSPAPESAESRTGTIRLVVAGRHTHQKNAVGLVEALAMARTGSSPIGASVDWYGYDPYENLPFSGPTPLQEATARIRALGLEPYFRIHPDSREIATIYRAADAIVLPSLFEGLPNIVCEAMGCGKPVLMSDVCDAGNLVRDGYNGYVFDPHSPASIDEVIRKFAGLSNDQRMDMGRNGRALAEEMFDSERVLTKTMQVLEAASRHAPDAIGHWIPEVPQTAYRALA